MGVWKVNNKKTLRDRIGRFPLLNFLFFSALSCFVSFYVVYLNDRGFSMTQIGLIVTINQIVAIVFQPIWGMLCDRLRSVRKVYVFCVFMWAILVPVLIFLRDYSFILFWIPLAYLFYSPLMSLNDSWTVQAVKNMPGKDYGSLRMWGSVGFMITIFVMGRVADIFSTEAVFLCFTVFALCQATVALCIPNEGVPPQLEKRAGFKDIQFKALFKNYYYVIFVICAFLLYIPIGIKNNYLIQRVEEAGGTKTIYGICLAIAAMSEIPMFKLSTPIINRFGKSQVLRFSMIAYAVQFTLLSFPMPPAGIMVAQALQGLSYGLFTASSVSYIDSLSPANMKTSALALANAIYLSFSAMIGSIVAGALMDSIGIMPVYFFGSILAAFAVALYLILYAIGKKNLPEPNYEA